MEEAENSDYRVINCWVRETLEREEIWQWFPQFPVWTDLAASGAAKLRCTRVILLNSNMA